MSFVEWLIAALLAIVAGILWKLAQLLKPQKAYVPWDEDLFEAELRKHQERSPLDEVRR